MAGHCRMEIYLASKGYVPETPLDGAQRTFDLGHTVERLMFEGIPELDIPRWWPNRIPELVDYSTGEVIIPAKIELQDRQDEVEVEGFIGHVDALGGPGEFFVFDCKTVPGRSWEKNINSNLLENPFSRENVMQMQFYLEGERRKRPALFSEESRAGLVYYNKENSRIMIRFVKYDRELVKEVIERLSWAKSGSEPVPDWAWQKGADIPLRCGYCSFKHHCAEMRGQALTLRQERGQPKWSVS